MKPQTAPQGKFKTRVGYFNFLTVNKHFCVSLPEGGEITIRGKCFTTCNLILKATGAGNWKVDQSFANVRRKEPMHEATPSQLQEIYKVINEDFNDYFHNVNPLLALQFKKFVRFEEIESLKKSREEYLKQVSSLQDKFANISAQIEKYL